MADVLNDTRRALKHVDRGALMITVTRLRRCARVFCIGNGGGYAHAMHFASDLRKLAHQDAYSFDNVAELTARINDNGWGEAWGDWLHAYGCDPAEDVVFMFSVGGGMDGLSLNLPVAEWGIVGLRGRYANRIVVPSESTPVIEGCQSVIAHHLIAEFAP